MKLTTKKLLERLSSLGSLQITVAEHAGDSDVIHLPDDCVLVVDEDDALPTVSLYQREAVGGNVTVEDWVIVNDAVLNDVIAFILSWRFSPLNMAT